MKISSVNNTIAFGNSRALKFPTYDNYVSPGSPRTPLFEAAGEPLAPRQQQSKDDLLNDGTELLNAIYAYYGNGINAKQQLLTDCVKLLNTLHVCESYNKNDEKLQNPEEVDCCNAANSENSGNRTAQPLYNTYAGLVFKNENESDKESVPVVDYSDSQYIIRETIKKRKGQYK